MAGPYGSAKLEFHAALDFMALKAQEPLSPTEIVKYI